MSALWTLGCRWGRRRGTLALGSGVLTLGPASPSPAWPWLLLRCPEVVVQRRLRPESRPESVYSTRVGIYWSGVVHTARRPHLLGVRPTLFQ